MHTFRTLPAIALTVLLLSACNQTTAPSNTETSSDVTAEGKMTMSMKDLVKLGKNYTCTFADVDDEGTRTDGTVYVQGERNFRGTFTMTDKNGKKINSQMLMANDTSYMWSDDEPQGIMMRLDPEDDGLFDDTATDDDDAAFEEDEPLELDCKKWSPTASTFVPPADREFVDFQAQMDLMMQNSGESPCDVCNQIPNAEGKEQCKKALSC